MTFKILPGQYFDQETNLHYNYFRDYDPTTGRYIESDPIGLRSGPNTYAYVGNNALRWMDPFGLARSRKGLPSVKVLPCDEDANQVCKDRCGCRGVKACQLVITPKFISMDEQGTLYREE